MEKQVAGNQGINANLNKIASAKENVIWDTIKDFQLKYKLEKPLYVYMKPLPLLKESSITGEFNFKLGDKVDEEIFNE